MEQLVPQEEWENVIADSAYTKRAVCEYFEISSSSLNSWLSLEVKPRQKSLEKMKGVIEVLQKEKRLQRHPSYGYATEEQIEKLKTIGLGPERDRILEQIAKQTESQGKVY